MKSRLYRFLNHYEGSYTRQILEEALDLFLQLWPYLVAGILLTALIKVYLSREKLALILQKNNAISIPLASLLGVFSPLGSYIIIPLSAALYTTGVPLPVLMALLVSSPLINPNLFILTQGAMGTEIAVARLIAAFMLGLLAGYFTAWLLKKEWLKSVLRSRGQNNPFTAEKVPAGWKSFGREVYRMTMYISKFFFLAILLAAAIRILTPPNLMIRIFRGNNFFSVLFSAGAGIPFYVCGGAAIPVVMELADLGLSKGSVLAFFIAGPVTRFSNLILMSAIFRRRIFTLYLAVGIIGAVAAGLLFDLL